MLTLAVTALLAEAANKASFITGGADGLQGIDIEPIFGMFRFDLFGRTAYLYCLAVLFLAWLFARRLVHSPFGRSLVGIRENAARMHAIGSPVRRRLLTIYTISAALAGIAGALLAQTTQFVGLTVLGFQRSGEIVIMLVFGGIGRLYGAFVGASRLHDRAGPAGEDRAGVLVFLDRPAAGAAGDVRARRHAGPDRPAAAPMTAGAGDHRPAQALRRADRRRTTSTSGWRPARATR